jgi:hypothetical protein
MKMHPPSGRRRELRPAHFGARACSLTFLAAVLSGGTHNAAAPLSSTACDASPVHYTPYKGVGPGLASLSWVAALPASSGLVGHLFYYDKQNTWRLRHAPRLHIYTMGLSPDGGTSMKILWEFLRTKHVPLTLSVRGQRLGGRGSLSQELSPTTSGPSQFPSIISVPTPGCWQLTLGTGRGAGRVTMIAVKGGH